MSIVNLKHIHKNLQPLIESHYSESSKPPILWDSAVKCAERNMRLIYRKSSVEEEYEKSKEEIAKHWDSIESHIKHYVFEMPYKVLQLKNTNSLVKDNEYQVDEFRVVCTVSEPLAGKL